MTTNIAQGFLEAILEQPEDDATRLIFADWLEEQNDPRGEFIRVQCERARLPAWDRRWVLLKWREQALLDAYGHLWRADLPRLDGIRWGEFRRGFIATVEAANFTAFGKHQKALWQHAPIECVEVRSVDEGIPRRGLGELPRLREMKIGRSYSLPENLHHLINAPLLHSLRVLDLSGCNLENAGVRVLSQSPHLGGLEELILEENYIGNQGMQAFSDGSFTSLRKLCLRGVGYGGYAEDPTIGLEGVRVLAESGSLSGLTSLDLSGQQIDSQCLRVLLRSANLANVEELILKDNDLQGHGLATVLEEEPRVRPVRLDLSENQIDNQGLAALVVSPLCDRLVDLNLNSCGLDINGPRPLAGSSASRRLCVLDLSQNRLGVTGVEYLTRGDFPALHTLSLADCDIGFGGAKRLAEWPSLANLLVLRLERNNLRKDGVTALANSPHVAGLHELGLGANSMNVPALNALVSQPAFGNLHVLGLEGNSLGKDGARILASAKYLGNLQQLRLGNTNLDEEGAHELAGAIRLPALTRLDLCNNDIGPGGVKELAAAPFASQLVELDVLSNRIGDEGLQALAQAGFDRLTTLNVHYNGISDAGMRVLLASKLMQTLQRLSVGGNRLSPAVHQRLLELLIEQNYWF